MDNVKVEVIQTDRIQTEGEAVNFARIRLLQKQEERLHWMIIKAEARATRITSHITGMPRGGGVGNKVESDVIEITMLRDKFTETSEELKARRAQLKKKIRWLRDPNVNLAIQLRYLHGAKIKDISETMYYSRRQILRYLKAGEQEIMKH